MLDGLDNASIEMEEAKVSLLFPYFVRAFLHEKILLSFYRKN